MSQPHDPELRGREIPAEVRFAILRAVPVSVALARAGMTTPSDTSRPDNPEQAIAVTYRTYYSLLEYVAIQKFRVPDVDVPDVIHEVVVAFIRSRPRINDERAWLVGAMCNASRSYWRAHGREATIIESDGEREAACVPDDIARRVDVSSMLRRLPRRCREVLRLRFFEEYSSDEIASHFETTINYARKMVYRCVSAARDMLLRAPRGRR